MKPEYTCNECGESCEPIKEEIHFSGTHCNNGRDGVLLTGFYVSDCCEVNYSEVEDERD